MMEPKDCNSQTNQYENWLKAMHEDLDQITKKLFYFIYWILILFCFYVIWLS